MRQQMENYVDIGAIKIEDDGSITVNHEANEHSQISSTSRKRRKTTIGCGVKEEVILQSSLMDG